MNMKLNQKWCKKYISDDIYIDGILVGTYYILCIIFVCLYYTLKHRVVSTGENVDLTICKRILIQLLLVLTGKRVVYFRKDTDDRDTSTRLYFLYTKLQQSTMCST